MSNIDKEISEIDRKAIQLKAQIEALEVEKVRLVTEKESAKKKIKSKEKLELVAIRKIIKNNIDKYNELATTNAIDTSVGLLTKGGSNIYEINDDNENEDGESFYEGDYSFNTYGPQKDRYGWFPSSLNC
jgi:uncharacterized protein YhaN